MPTDFDDADYLTLYLNYIHV